MAGTVRVKVFLQVEPEWGNVYNDPGRDQAESVRAAKIVGSTQGRSRKPKPGTIEVAITIEIPKSAFIALHPEATVVIPESLTQSHPITVEATDANAED